MGYYTSGTYEKKLLIDNTDGTYYHVKDTVSIHCGNKYCMCVLLENNEETGNIDTYKILGFKQKNYNIGKQPCINGNGVEITETEQNKTKIYILSVTILNIVLSILLSYFLNLKN